MNFSSLMNAFGLGSQNYNDPSLGQGRQLNDFNRTYTKQIGPQLKKLQETGIPGVSSVTEAMDASKPNVGVQTRKTDQVSELEDQFSKKLAEYNAAYKLFSEAVLKTNKAGALQISAVFRSGNHKWRWQLLVRKRLWLHTQVFDGCLVE